MPASQTPATGLMAVDPLSWTLFKQSLGKTSVLLESANITPQTLSESDTPETNGFVSSDTPRQSKSDNHFLFIVNKKKASKRYIV